MVTKEVSNYLADSAVYFNKHLFASSLPSALITISRKKSAFGYFSFGSFSQDNIAVDEIALTPDALSRGTLANLSTLVHELVHQWQFHFGKPGANGYHNKQWANKMRSVGLKPISYDHPLLETGYRCSHEVIPDGLFFEVAEKFIKIQGELPVKSTYNLMYSVKGIKRRPKLICKNCNQSLTIPFNLNIEVMCKSCSRIMETDNEN